MRLRTLLEWPRTLFARLAIIFLIGILLAQTLSFWVTVAERNQATTSLMMGYIEREVASSVALLDHLPAEQRALWLPRLARRSYNFILGPGEGGPPLTADLSARVAESINIGLGKTYELRANAIPGDHERLQVHLKLGDGTPLTVNMRPMSGVPLSPWLPAVLAGQLALLAACCWVAVRSATHPLLRLAQAADTLGPDMKAVHLPEDGPAEVAQAARAFNAMQDRISTYTTERIQILAAISHDLQTPITRMNLRLDLMDESEQHIRLREDLRLMSALVREGVAYARTLHGTTETARPVDINGFLNALVCDYLDAGQDVTLSGWIGMPRLVPPDALRRVATNLIDNALKYAGSAEISVHMRPDDRLTLTVTDRGPGIPPALLEAVFTPFFRLESSRNRHTGGTGLGLAIARQLTLAMDGQLILENREGGGLAAIVVIKAHAALR
jgi:signal transduction histidine kinase